MHGTILDLLQCCDVMIQFIFFCLSFLCVCSIGSQSFISRQNAFQDSLNWVSLEEGGPFYKLTTALSF